MNIVDIIIHKEQTIMTIARNHFLGIIEYKVIQFDKIVEHYFMNKNNQRHGHYKKWNSKGELIRHDLYLEDKLVNIFLRDIKITNYSIIDK